MKKAAPSARPMNLSVNAIRTAAAVLVVVSHLRALFFVDFVDSHDQGSFAKVFYLATSLGHQAVIVFFVLSGYWVSRSVIRGTATGEFDVRFYATSRLTRLWIVLMPAILLTQLLDRLGTSLFPTSSIYSGSEAYHSVVPSDGALPHLDPLTTLGNLFFLQSIHVTAAGTDTALWSLAYEFWYYVLFPAALIAMSRRYASYKRLLAGGVFLAAAFVAGPQALALFPTWLLGAALAWKQRQLVSAWLILPSKVRVALRVFLLALTAGVCVLMSLTSLPEPIQAYPVAIVSALLIGTLVTDVSGKSARRVLAIPSWAAEWSYSLYATHLPVLAFAAAFIVPVAANRAQVGVPSLAAAIGLLLLVCFVAYGFYTFSEKHTNTLRSSIMSRIRPRLIPAPGTSGPSGG